MGGGKDGGWGEKELSRIGKTAYSSSEADNKERFDTKPKSDDGGDRPFVMRRRRCD